MKTIAIATLMALTSGHKYGDADALKLLTIAELKTKWTKTVFRASDLVSCAAQDKKDDVHVDHTCEEKGDDDKKSLSCGRLMLMKTDAKVDDKANITWEHVCVFTDDCNDSALTLKDGSLMITCSASTLMAGAVAALATIASM